MDIEPETIEALLSEAHAPERLPSRESRDYAEGLARLLAPERSSFPRRIARLLSGNPRLALRGGEPIQRVWETDTHRVLVRDEPDDPPGERYLIGQVFASIGGALAPQSVALLGGASEKNAELIGSEFHLSGVPNGVFLLRCLFEDEEILVPQIEVGIV